LHSFHLRSISPPQALQVRFGHLHLRRDCQGLLIVMHGLVNPPKPLQQLAQITVRLGVLRSVLDGQSVVLEGTPRIGRLEQYR